MSRKHSCVTENITRVKTRFFFVFDVHRVHTAIIMQLQLIVRKLHTV